MSQGADSGGRDDGIRRRLGREAERGQTVHDLRRTLGVRLGIVATGGVDTPAKALAVLKAGADAVGCFTAAASPLGPDPMTIASLAVTACPDLCNPWGAHTKVPGGGRRRAVGARARSGPCALWSAFSEPVGQAPGPRASAYRGWCDEAAGREETDRVAGGAVER